MHRLFMRTMSTGLVVADLCVMITGCGPAKTETPTTTVTHTSLTELPGDDTGVTENIMITAYFDKIDLDDNHRMLFGIQSY